MARTTKELQGLTKLGSNQPVRLDHYDPALLEAFVNKHPHYDYWVTLTCPEFTTLCPLTGQPDFATITIQYIPGDRLVESKSLKLYLFSFRNHGDFHEDCVNIILNDLAAAMDPRYIEVWGRFMPRGGITIDPYCNRGRTGTAYADLAAERFRLHNLYPARERHG